MRQVINFTLYDTETAQCLHEWDNGQGDLRYREKSLYRGPGGTYFLYHVGGPMTDMARQTGDNNWSGSARIEPIDEPTAIRFLESHGGSEVILAEFGDRIREG